MEKVIVIHQPDFLPYLGFFHRLLKADLFVILDHVQFLRGSKSWHNRDKIKTPQGEKWITVSVKEGPQATPINEVLLSDNQNWKEKNLNQIYTNYKKAPYFDEIFPYAEKLYQYEFTKLVDFNMKSIELLMNLFQIEVDIKLSSSLSPQGKSNELLVDILKKVDATTYYSGVGARAYYKSEPFEEAGIKVIWQDFIHPVYPQLHGEFIPYLSSIDLFFNCGIEKAREMIRSI